VAVGTAGALWYSDATSGREIRILGSSIDTGSEIFVDGLYSDLDVRGKVVIDVGANIGDSAIYFSLRGATRVLAYEPNTRLYALAAENLRWNKITNVDLTQAWVAGDPTRIRPEFLSRMRDTQSSAEAQVGPQDIATVTLTEILNRIPELEIVLKMDCEGAEYSILLSTPFSELSRVTTVELEYHFGASILLDYLELCGFAVRASAPRYLISLRERQVMANGTLRAWRGPVVANTSEVRERVGVIR
jgi:FkbM family methyltransferase